MFIAKRIVVLLCLCLMLAGCGGSLKPFVGGWKEPVTGMVFYLKSDGRYTMTDHAGKEFGEVWHDSGDYYIFRAENGRGAGVKNRFKLTVSDSGEELSIEIPDGTALKFNRIR